MIKQETSFSEDHGNAGILSYPMWTWYFKNKTSELAEAIRSDEQPFDLIELGAGDAMKSTYLLKYLSEKRADFTYMPIDISGNILSVLENNLKDKLPEINIKTLEGEYFQMLKKQWSFHQEEK